MVAMLGRAAAPGERKVNSKKERKKGNLEFVDSGGR